MSQILCHGDVTTIVVPQTFSDLSGTATGAQLPGGAPTGSGVVVMASGPTITGATLSGSTVSSGILQTKRLNIHGGTAISSGNIALSAGWGTSPTLTIVRGTDQAAVIQITAKATVSANPTVTVTFADGTFTQVPVVVPSRSDTVAAAGAPTASVANEWVVTNTTATAVTFTFVGTPVANNIYGLTWIALGI